MSFLSGLSNIFHGIGHIFDGGNADDERKKQQEQAQQQAQNNAPAVDHTPAQAPQQQQTAAPTQLLEKYDPSKDFYGGAFKGFGNFDDNGTLAKVQQPTVQAQPAPEAPKEDLWHKALGFGKAVVHPFAEFGNAAIHVPQAIGREIQNKPITDIQQNVFGTTNEGEILKKIVGDTAQVGLAVAAPGISSAAESGVSAAVAPELTTDILGLVKAGIPLDVAKQVAEEAAGRGTSALVKYGGQALGGGLINTGFSGISDAEQNGATPLSLLEKVPQNFVTGAALDVGLHGAGDLVKAGANNVSDAIAAHSGPSADEIAPGIKSANENHLADAVKQTTADEASQAPVVPPDAAPGAAAPEAPAAQPVVTPAVADEAAKAAAPAPADVNAAPTPGPDAKTAENAPRVRKANAKQLSDISESLKNTGDEHTVFSNPELTDAGKNVVDTMKDDEVVSKYARPVKFTAPEDVAVAKASRDRLANIIRTGTPEAKASAQDALNNLVDAAAEVQSRSGRILNYGQEMLDGMPPEAKVAYYIKHIDQLNLARYGEDHATIAADPAERQAVEAQFNKFLTKDEALKTQVATERGILDQALDPATRGNVSVDELKAAKAAVDDLEKQLRQNGGEMTKYYDSLTPKRAGAEVASDWQRSSMLSSPTGRAHALGSTVVGVADQSLKEAVAGTLGKAYNAVVSPEKAVRDTGPGIGDILKGGWEGLKKTGNEARGNFEVSNPEKAIKNSVGDNSSEMNAFKGGRFKKVVNAATHLHSNVTEGVKVAEIARDARVDGLKQGLEGEDLQKYIISRSDQPSAQMIARANEAHLQLNNLNNNPLTDTVTKAANAVAGKSVVGNVIKNQLLPFPRFVAGNIWNQVTDKNVVAAFGKTVASAVKGDAQGFIDNVAKLGVEGGKTYALGWLLTKNGTLTNKDANGKSYDGVYLHIGNRYIPASTLGFVAPSLVIGNATYNAFNTPDHKGSFLDHLGKTVTDATMNMYKSVAGADVLGAGSSLTGPIDQATQSGDPSKLLKIGTNVVTQNIPAALSDVNSVLNQTGLNPTHEAAQTTVKELNPATGNQKTNPVKTAEATLLNKVPGLSQTLPRQTGVASADPLDKVLHSTQDTSTTIKTRNDAQAKVDQATADKAAGIPDPNGKNWTTEVKARLEDGKYDQVIKSYQQKLDAVKNDENVPKSEKTKYEDAIKQATVLKDGGYEPKTIDLYAKTSLSEWRNMGDPESDAYDPATYALLYRYDGDLAKAGISGNNTIQTDNKYSPKKPAKGGSGGKAASTGNTLSSAPGIGRISFGNLSPQKITNAAIPALQSIPAGGLIKQRTITLGKVK